MPSGRTLVALVSLVLAGCGRTDGSSAPAAHADGAAPGGEVLVSAAASLTDAFAEMELAFEAIHPSVDVRLNLGGSSALRAQILEGAPVDVFASANTANMDPLVHAGAVAGDPSVFVHNRLLIAVPTGNPSGVTGLGDFSREALRLGLCAEGVPCGDFARAVLERAGIRPSPDTEEPDVRALLTKIELGELDAGITYATDLNAATGVQGLDIPDSLNVVADYPIAVLTRAPNPAAAQAFVAFVLSEAGRTVLARHGFLLP